MIKIYTDGSCIGNPGNGGWAAIIIDDKKKMNAVYASSDFFVFASIQEAFGKTWTEAMACKIPVVCFNNTSAAEIVDHKIDGYIVPKNDEFFSEYSFPNRLKLISNFSGIS